MYRFPLPLSTTRFRQFSGGFGLIPLAFVTACSAQDAHPAVEVRTVTVTREIQRPCAVAIPKRPAPLAKPYPSDAVALSAVLARKLLEWSGPGAFGDRAVDALGVCTKP